MNRMMLVLALLVFALVFVIGCTAPPPITEPPAKPQPPLNPTYDSWNISDNEIIQTYADYIKDVDSTLQNDQIRCSLQPTVEEITFTSLKLKRPLYKINSDCRARCLHPGCALPYWTFYTSESGNQVIISRSHKGFENLAYKQGEALQDHFSELFEDLETEEQLLEYAVFSPLVRRLNTLDDSLSVGYVTEDKCEYEKEAPVVAQLVSRNEEGFGYEGYYIDPEFEIKIYYFSYSITNDGRVTEHERTVIAKCGEGIFF